MNEGQGSLILGIDAGGTRTRAAIMDGDKLLSRVEGDSVKRLRVGVEAADRNLRALLTDAFGKAGVKGVNAASVGLASSTMPGVKEWFGGVLKEYGVEQYEIVGDEYIAIDAAVKGGPGILQIAGTGSNCIGRMADGSRECAGGWSSRLGDEGSGYWIGLHSVRRALHAHDREKPCRILEEVGKLWGTKSLDELVQLGNDKPGPDFAALPPLISQLAEEGDKVALSVLKQASDDLVAFVLLVRDKMRRKRGLTEEVPLAWIGSIIGKIRIVREGFFGGLRIAVPGMQILEEEAVGIEGAIWRAKQLAKQAK
jgi:N-acetylglucosamine kinase-like BadF-type ATPase